MSLTSVTIDSLSACERSAWRWLLLPEILYTTVARYIEDGAVSMHKSMA